MKPWTDLLWGVVRMCAVAAGVLYAGRVLMTYARTGGHFQPELDRNDRLATARQLLLWAGVKATGAIARLARPLVNMLAEASAEVGEWALARHASQHALRPRS